jgi:hypothetical protein
MIDKTRADQVSGGVFLIGLALLFITGYWWPGILFLIGASSMARGVAEGRDWYSIPGGLWMIGLGLVFAFGFSWPLLLILIGVSMIFGQSWRGRKQAEEKAKNEDAPAPEKPKRDTYIVDETESGDETTIEELLDNKSQNH